MKRIFDQMQQAEFVACSAKYATIIFSMLSLLVLTAGISRGQGGFSVKLDMNESYGVWKPVPDGAQSKVSISYKIGKDITHYRLQNNYPVPVYIILKVFYSGDTKNGSSTNAFLLPNEVVKDGGWHFVGEPANKITVECISIGKNSSQAEEERIKSQKCSKKSGSQGSNDTNGNTTLNFPGAKKSNQILTNPENATPSKDNKPQKEWSKSHIIEYKDTYAKTSQVEFSNKWTLSDAMAVRFFNSDKFKAVVFYYVVVMQGKYEKQYTKGSWVLTAEKEYTTTAYGNALEKVIICASELECRKIIPDAFK
jgi:hypothetical protein